MLGSLHQEERCRFGQISGAGDQEDRDPMQRQWNQMQNDGPQEWRAVKRRDLI